MGKKHKSDLELFKENIAIAEREEHRLEQDRIRKNKAYKLIKKKRELSKRNAEKFDTEKPIGNNALVKRDKEGRLLPGSTLISPTRFVPGKSGNPSGRPKKSFVDDLMLDFFASSIVDSTKKRKRNGRKRKNVAATILIRTLFQQAIAGKKGIAQLLLERVGGKPKQEIDAQISNATEYTPEQRLARIKELTLKLNK